MHKCCLQASSSVGRELPTLRSGAAQSPRFRQCDCLAAVIWLLSKETLSRRRSMTDSLPQSRTIMADAVPSSAEAAAYDQRLFIEQLALVGIRERRLEFAKQW